MKKQLNQEQFYKEMKSLIDRTIAQVGRDTNCFFLDFDERIKALEMKSLINQAIAPLTLGVSTKKRLIGWNFICQIKHAVLLPKEEADLFMDKVKNLMEEYGITIVDAQLINPKGQEPINNLV